jgi:rhamnogalacturonan endolyase
MTLGWSETEKGSVAMKATSFIICCVLVTAVASFMGGCGTSGSGSGFPGGIDAGADGGSGSGVASSSGVTGSGSSGGSDSGGTASSSGASGSGSSGSGGASSSSGASGSSGSGSGGMDAGGLAEGGSSSGSSSGFVGADSGIPVAPSCPVPTGTPVTLTQTGGNLVLSNGLVTVTIASNGQVTQVAKNGTNMMAAGETMYVSESGGATYYAINASSHTIVQQTAAIVELSFIDTSGAPHDMDWDLHYVMRQGVSGFYYFLLTQVGTPTHPNPATLSELRTVQRFDETVLSNGYVGERHGLLPQEAQLLGTQIQNAAFVMTVAPTILPTVSSLPGVTGQDYDEGTVFTKYDWATYRTEDQLHGLYGNGFGVWMLSPSWEFYTGGPLKQELMIQDGTLMLNMYHGGHAGSAITTPSPADWHKVYGPNLVYVNTGSDDAAIADAQAQFATEQSQWPYCWMNDSVYPLAAQRGTVTGTIAEAHGRSVAGAVVTLAQTGTLIDQGYDYMFWTQADANGNFTIPEVRPNTYSVHVYATQGTIVDDATHGEIAGTVTVVPGNNDVGTLTWSPPYHANLLWSIGTSDQRSGEFRVFPNVAPGATNTAYQTGRMYAPTGDGTVETGIWTVPPANTTYTIGTSTPQTDWYFVQSVDGTWTVDFNLSTVPTGGATLTIALAGAAREANLATAINGHQVLNMGLGNDQTLYRSCLEGGLFQMITATVPAADLVAGANTATFTVANTWNATTMAPASAGPGAGVFYDIIKLESD